MNINNGKVKLLVFGTKLYGGGSQRVLSYLSQYLPENIYKTFVYTNPNKGYPYRGEMRFIELPRFTRRRQYHLHVLRFLKMFWIAKKIIREVEPDVIISQSFSWRLIVAVLSKRAIVPIWNTPSRSFGTGFIQRIVLRWVCNRALSIVNVSEGVRKDLESNFGIKNSIVIYTPTDLDRIEEGMKEPLDADLITTKWAKDKIPMFITLGRSSPQKGHGHLIRAFAAVRKQRNCKLVIMGVGVPENTYLENLIGDLDLKEDAILLDFQKNPFKFMANSMAFVMSSVYEGFPNVCMEAMACNLPVISTDCGHGPREILAPDTPYEYKTRDIEYAKYGILTPVCDGRLYSASDPITREEGFLARAMLEILDNDNKCEHYRLASADRAKDFGKRPFIEKWAELLQSNRVQS